MISATPNESKLPLGIVSGSFGSVPLILPPNNSEPKREKMIINKNMSIAM